VAAIEVQEEVVPTEVVEPVAEAQEPTIPVSVEAAQIVLPIEPVVAVEVSAIPETTPTPKLPVAAAPVEETAEPEADLTPIDQRADTPPTIVQEIQAEDEKPEVDVEAESDVVVAQETPTPIADEDVTDIPIGEPTVPEGASSVELGPVISRMTNSGANCSGYSRGNPQC
jgi:hypothetical protein